MSIFCPKRAVLFSKKFPLLRGSLISDFPLFTQDLFSKKIGLSWIVHYCEFSTIQAFTISRVHCTLVRKPNLKLKSWMNSKQHGESPFRWDWALSVPNLRTSSNFRRCVTCKRSTQKVNLTMKWAYAQKTLLTRTVSDNEYDTTST